MEGMVGDGVGLMVVPPCTIRRRPSPSPPIAVCFVGLRRCWPLRAAHFQPLQLCGWNCRPTWIYGAGLPGGLGAEHAPLASHLSNLDTQIIV